MTHKNESQNLHLGTECSDDESGVMSHYNSSASSGKSVIACFLNSNFLIFPVTVCGNDSKLNQC